MIVDVSMVGVVVRPERRQHSKAFIVRGLAFVIAKHALVESVWIPTLVVHAVRDVAVCINLIK